MLIAEVNHEHCDIIRLSKSTMGGQRAHRGQAQLQHPELHDPIHALLQKGFRVGRMIVTTLQGLSGAGYPRSFQPRHGGQHHPLHRRRGGEIGERTQKGSRQGDEGQDRAG